MKTLLGLLIYLFLTPTFAEISPGEIDKYAPPRVSPERLKKIESFLDLRSPSLGMLTPDGKNYFFNWKVTGISQVWKMDGNFPVQMTGGMHSTFLQDITPDGKYLIISRDQNGQEKPGLFLQPTTGGRLLKIYHQKGIKVRYSLITNDSKYIFFWANDKNPVSFTLYKFSIADKKLEEAFYREGYWSLSDLTGEKYLLSKWRGHNTSEYYEYFPLKNQLVPLFGQGEEEEYIARYGKNKELLVLTNKFSEFNRIYKYVEGKFEPVLPPNNFEIYGPSINRKKTRLIYTAIENGFKRFEVVDLTTLKKLPLPDFSDYVHTGYGSTTPDARYTAIALYSNNRPKTSAIYDWETKKIRKILSPSTPEVDTSRFLPAKLEFYPSRDGVKIPMLVRRPKKCLNRACPVIVNFHGGPESQSRPGFSPYRQLFLEKGFIFVDPNVRGSSGMGKSWAKADDGVKRLKVITDIQDVATYIRNNWKVAKIGVMGGSYGGYATLYAMTRFAGSYDAGLAKVGMSNLKTFLENTSGYRRKLRISEYGDPEKDQEFLKELSPVTYLENIKDPIFLQHGLNDPRVPASESLQIQEMMEQKGINGQLVLFPDEGHGVRKRKNRALSYSYALDFFEKHLFP